MSHLDQKLSPTPPHSRDRARVEVTFERQRGQDFWLFWNKSSKKEGLGRDRKVDTPEGGPQRSTPCATPSPSMRATADWLLTAQGKGGGGCRPMPMFCETLSSKTGEGGLLLRP